jgi:uncharacterized protein (DUF1778 family)
LKKKIRVEFRATEEFKKLLESEATKNGMSLSEYIVRCLYKRHNGRPQDRWAEEWTEANLIY